MKKPFIKNISQRKKMVLGYVFVIVLPFVLFFASLAHGYVNRVNEAYLYVEHQHMQEEYGSLLAQLSLFKSYHLLFQNDKAVNRYMNGVYKSVSSEMESFLRDIRPLFAFISSSGTDITDVSVYCAKKPRVPLQRQMIYNPKVSQLAETLDVRGNWSFAGDGVDSLLWKYQVPMYSDIFLERLGMFEFTVDMSRLLKRLAEVGPGSRRYLFAGGGWYRIYPEGAVPQRAEADTLLNASIGQIGAAWREGASFSGGGALVNSMPLPELDAVLLSVTEKNAWMNMGGFGPQTLFIGVLFAALSALYYMLISSLSNIAELKKREADFLALQAQIRPHFLYNSLETARMIADSNGDEEAGDFLFNLGRFVRFSFSSAEKDIPLETELEIVEKYLYLYKTSMGNRLEYTVEKDAEASNVICPPFIVQPLVENSLHHAFGENAQRLTIAVSVKIEKGAAVITVRDDGKGIPGEKIEGLLNKPVEDDAPVRRYVKGSGLGLSNTNRRLKEFFGGRAVLTVESEAGKGTVCTITIWEEL